jgi:hypothetical protein
MNHAGIKHIFVILFFLNCSVNVFGTIQIPDLLIHKGDTLLLYNDNPLESYYNDKIQRPYFFRDSSATVWHMSTACWRGYQATWEIKEDKLYLIEIAECYQPYTHEVTEHSLQLLTNKLQPEVVKKISELKGKKYTWKAQLEEDLTKKLNKEIVEENKKVILDATKIPRKTINLEKQFREHCLDGKVFANWFSGTIQAQSKLPPRQDAFADRNQYEKKIIIVVKDGVIWIQP